MKPIAIGKAIGLGTLTWLVALSVAAEPKASPYPSMAPLEKYLMADKNAEIALARSAAPPSISADATIMVLGKNGYEVATEGKNGFVCLVDRAWQAAFDDPEFWNPKIRAPLCMNPQAARSILPTEHKQTALALSGLTQLEILARMKAASEKGEIPAPEPGAMSYMLSKSQYLSDRGSHWHPHLMFYLPSKIDQVALGANRPGSPVLGGPEPLPGGGQLPTGVFFVPVGAWSDGSAYLEK